MRFLALLLAFVPATALAADGAQVPEPSTISLVALGLVGVLVGRRVARRSDDTDPDE